MEDESKIVITDQDLPGESPHTIENIRENLEQSDGAAKVAALRHEIQLGIESLAEGGGIVLKTPEDITKFMAEFYD